MSLKNSLIVLWVYIMYVSGLWFFLSGYLLKRIVVHQNSTSVLNLHPHINCKDITTLRYISENFNQEITNPAGNTHLQRYNKAVIIIIDALRFDFVKHHKELKPGSEFHLNQMPVFEDLVEKHPDQARLFKLIADPPTTTLQRLKGMTTGSLPTFIDVSLNFASSEITEDNIIRQLLSRNKSIVFMGDDTWESIFPDKFRRSFPYPSFNVKDLDTVDNGILTHLYEEMDKSDWDILIAHFLGVDHCGHRYGPRHPEMTRKLQQMNSVIQNVIEKLEKDTVLLVLGDHGMTENGDHGGDSIPEITTALFVYSPSKLLTHASKGNVPTVNQVDLVPTLSLLLGVPIPFSNLGSVISSLFQLNLEHTCFQNETDSLLAAALASAENCHQVQKYLHSYNQISNELSHSFVTNAQKRLDEIDFLWRAITHNKTRNREVLFNISGGYMEYLDDVRNVCSEKWASFNMHFIVAGIILFCISVLCNFWIAEQISNNHMIAGVSTIFLISVLTLSYVYELFDSFMWLTMGMIMLIIILLRAFRDLYYLYNFIVICLLFVFLCIAYYYDWFVFNYFEYASLVFTIIFITFYVKKMSNNYLQQVKGLFSLSSIFPTVLFLTSFSNSFVINEDRITLFLLQSIIVYRFYPELTDTIKAYCSSISTKSKINKKQPKLPLKSILQPVLLTCLILCVRMGSMFYKCREEQIFCENSLLIVSLEKLHQSQAYKLMRLILSLCCEGVPVLIFLGTMCYNYTIKSQTVSAVFVKYGIFFVCMLTSLRWWLNIVPPNVVDRILKGNEIILTRTALLASVLMIISLSTFPILMDKPWEVPSKEIYFGSYTTFVFIVLQMLYLVSGDALSTAIMFMGLSALLYGLMILMSSNSTESHIWLEVLIWGLLSRHWFYATAHQPTFPSIQWDAAFLLNHKEVYSYTLSGTLVLANTFASFIFHGVALPVIMIPQDASFLTSKYLLRLHMKYLFYTGFKVLGSICAAFVLRRHLMVWKIFSPKLLYEVIGMLITMMSVSAGHFFMSKVTSQYHKLIRMNMNHMFASREE